MSAREKARVARIAHSTTHASAAWCSAGHRHAGQVWHDRNVSGRLRAGGIVRSIRPLVECVSFGELPLGELARSTPGLQRTERLGLEPRRPGCSSVESHGLTAVASCEGGEWPSTSRTVDKHERILLAVTDDRLSRDAFSDWVKHHVAPAEQ